MEERMIAKFLFHAERVAAYYQGKGWGSSTVEGEFAAAVSLLDKAEVKLCVDIGGNKGAYTDEITRAYPNAKVVVFEPAKVNVVELTAKFGKNGNVVIEPFGVANKSGSATLYSNEEGSGLASLTKRRLGHFDIDFEFTESVQTIIFEKYWKEALGSKKIDICKIDIEGHELDALAGFGEALKHIDVLQFEFGGCNIDTRTFFQDFWYFFTENNFELYRITRFGAVKLDRYSELDEFFSTTNYLAKRLR